MRSAGVSVAMTTHNGDSFLIPQLESIVNQERRPDEVVIGDDGSGDRTLELLEEFSRSAPFDVRIETSDTHLGSTANFSRVVQLCTGDIIATCDQDDVWLPHKLRRLQEIYRDRPEIAGAFSDAYLIDARGRRYRQTLWSVIGFSHKYQQRFDEEGIELLADRFVVSGCTMSFRREFLPLILPFPSDPDSAGDRLVHDRWVSLVLAAVGEMAAIPEPLVEYRIHDAQQIGISRFHLRRLLPLHLVRAGLLRLSPPHASRHSEITLRHLGLVRARVEASRGHDQSSRALARLDRQIQALPR